MTVTSADYSRTYIDGETPPYGGGEFSSPAIGRFHVSNNARGVGVYSTHGTKAMILVSSNDGSMLSNYTWKCVNYAPTNWWYIDFNDASWPNAVELGSNNGSFKTPVPGFSPDAKWISAPNTVGVLVCRGYFGNYQRVFSIECILNQQDFKWGSSWSASVTGLRGAQ